MRAFARSCRLYTTCLLLAPVWLSFSAAAPSGPDTMPAGDARVPGKAYVERWVEPAPSFKPVELAMVYVPAGKFVMGSGDDERGRERSESPRHEVQVGGFWMSKYEVTWHLYFEWKRETNAPVQFYDWADPGAENELCQMDEPAVALTQYAAQEFCRWLSRKTGRLYRLPTEAEWEYACRAGTTTAWHFGDDPKRLSEYAWFGGGFYDGFRPVGQKKPNAWGLYDMHGNVSEWVLDGWSDDYARFAGKVNVDPWVPRTDAHKHGVVRGGDWTSKAERTGSAARHAEMDEREIDIDENTNWTHRTPAGMRVGFRVVSPVKPERDGRERSIREYDERQSWGDVDAGQRVPLRIEVPKPGSVVFHSWQHIKEAGVEWPGHPDKARLMVPVGTENVARGMPVSSDPSMTPTWGTLDLVTDGEKSGAGDMLVLPRGLRWVQIDLHDSTSIRAVMVWHGMEYGLAYRDVIVQVSDAPWFKEGVTTIFNNDADGSAGLGKGKDREYADTVMGRLIDAKGVKARYVRLYADGGRRRGGWIAGETVWSEVEVYGRPTAAGRAFREEQQRGRNAVADEKR